MQNRNFQKTVEFLPLYPSVCLLVEGRDGGGERKAKMGWILSSPSSSLLVPSIPTAFPIRTRTRNLNSPSKSESKFLRAYPCPPPRRGSTLRCFSLPQPQQEEKGKPSSEESDFQFERLFSNLNQATMKRDPGSVTSGVLLVAGTTVGAGILAIPAVTQDAGFLASALTCILCWVYMVSMAMRTLGNIGVQVACWSYLFIHYALLVAYVARSSDILTNSFGIPLWESATLFSMFFGGMCYFGSQRVIGAINGLLVFGILTSFTALVGVASGNLQWNSLFESHFEAIPQSIPIIALSFVYQNVVPVLCTNLEGNLSKVRTSIVLGTAIPLILFLVWDAVILGTLPNIQSVDGAVTDPLDQLRSSNGIVGPIVEVFSFLAIGTSYIGFVLGLSDFISDLLKLPSGQSKPLPYLLTLVPPLVLSLLDPEIFFKALDFAGTYGVLVLFGVLPAAMSWSERYSDAAGSPVVPPVVPGGKLTLAMVMGGAILVICSELFENFVHL